MTSRLAAFVLCAWPIGCRAEAPCEGPACGGNTPSCVGEDCDGGPASSPWYVYIGNDLEDGATFRLFGVREADMGEKAPLELTADVATDGYLGPTFYSWSPDGRFLVFDLIDEDYQSRLFFTTFGGKLPGGAAPIPELPFSDAWYPDATWSAGGETALVRDGSDFYWIDFRGEEPVASLLGAAGGTPISVSPCADGEHLVYGLDSGGTFVATAPSLDDPELLGKRVFLAPDGQHVVIADPEDISTAECGLGKPRHHHETEMQDEAGSFPPWSPDSRFYAFPSLGLDGVSGELTVIDAVGDEEPWSMPAFTISAQWDTVSARLIFEGPSGDLQVATFPGGQTASLGLPLEAETVALHALGVSYLTSFDDTEVRRQWWLADATNNAVELTGCNDIEARYDEGPTAAACVTVAGLKSSLLAFAFDDGQLVSRAELNEPGTEALAIEGFSPSGRGFVASRATVTEELLRAILWVPRPFTENQSLAEVHPGAIAYGGSFQPQPR
jgi:hypothetical protein